MNLEANIFGTVVKGLKKISLLSSGTSGELIPNGNAIQQHSDTFFMLGKITLVFGNFDACFWPKSFEPLNNFDQLHKELKKIKNSDKLCAYRWRFQNPCIQVSSLFHTGALLVSNIRRRQ